MKQKKNEQQKNGNEKGSLKALIKLIKFLARNVTKTALTKLIILLVIFLLVKFVATLTYAYSIKEANGTTIVGNILVISYINTQ
jgi:hypothetical protein